MDASALAAAAADIISDRLREHLLDSEEMPEGNFDTTLARRDGDDLIVELVELSDGAVTRDDGRRVLRIVIEEVR
jgi:hypothetical protein